MGNSGSTHHMSIERLNTSPNSYIPTHLSNLRRSSHRQYQLNRSDLRSTPAPQGGYTTEWRRSYPSSSSQKLSKSKIDENAQFKVLPRLDKRLHLRATTNGAILNSGGTISGRKQNENPAAPSPIAVVPMQRSRTFIIDSKKDLPSSGIHSRNTMQTEFMRSQTLLPAKPKLDQETTAVKSNLSRMQRHTYSEPELMQKMHLESATEQNCGMEPLNRSGKRNKYTKKRRAPDAPTPTSVATLATVRPELVPNKDTSVGPARHTHFTKNADRQSKLNKDMSHLAQISGPIFRRGVVERNSVNCGQPGPIVRPNITYRREKSSDAIMFKSKKSPEIETTVKSSEEKRSPHYQNNSNSSNRLSLLPAAPRPDTLDKKGASPELQGPAKTSKIPQLKRTFYFGMDINSPSDGVQETQDAQKLSRDGNVTNAKSNLTTADADKEFSSEGISLTFLPAFDTDYEKSTGQQTEENIDDNGLRIRIRPTLPRRQIDTPSFSPTLAWRSLLEEEARLEKNFKCRNINVEQDVCQILAKTESPIQARRVPRIRQVHKLHHQPAAWTPEQDLGEENDERAKALAADDDSSSDEYRSKCEGDALLFYGSKSKQACQYPVPSIHTFSLSLPRDAHIQHARNADNLRADDVIYKSLQKPKLDYYFGKRPTEPQKNESSRFVCDNWMLHKNVSSMELYASTKSLEDADNRNGLPSIEPQSLKFLTGGKHVMYLPGNYDKSVTPLKSDRTELHPEAQAKAKTNRHFKNRQRHVPENLQDKTPIFPVMSYNEPVGKLDDTDKPFHQRFSFHSTVRLLEKKLHPEKPVKDADIEKARKSELEALKRVEEDFQRNRANEKENIRYQLRLHFGLEGEYTEEYQSLPIAPVLNSFSSINLNDTNNNLFRRDDPDGCVATVSVSGPEGKLCKESHGAKDI